VLAFWPDIKQIINVFDKITIEESGVINFGNYSNSRNTILFNDLLVAGNGKLTIKNWKDTRDYLLVRKSSSNTQGSLRNIQFEGYDPRSMQLLDFDSDYWQLTAIPEPATYGALFGAIGISLVGWRKKRRSPLQFP